MTYSEFRYLWNVKEVEKDNVARLKDITNVMTVTKVSVLLSGWKKADTFKKAKTGKFTSQRKEEVF